MIVRSEAVFNIRDILVRIQIADPYLLLTDPYPTPDPDPAIFVSDLQDGSLFAYYSTF